MARSLVLREEEGANDQNQYQIAYRIIADHRTVNPSFIPFREEDAEIPASLLLSTSPPMNLRREVSLDFSVSVSVSPD